MKTVYLCGAINGCTDQQCKDWRNYTKEKLKGKYEFLDPMRRDFRGKEDSSVKEIVNGDYYDINHTDILLGNANSPSWGTGMEIHYAYQIGKKVILVCNAERVSPWLRYHSDKIVKTLDEAIELLEKTNDKHKSPAD
jgi:hypothetical protein